MGMDPFVPDVPEVGEVIIDSPPVVPDFVPTDWLLPANGVEPPPLVRDRDLWGPVMHDASWDDAMEM